MLRVVWVVRVPWFNTRLSPYLIQVFSFVTRWSYLGNRFGYFGYMVSGSGFMPSASGHDEVGSLGLWMDGYGDIGESSKSCVFINLLLAV
jgi:hypothetical protein